MIRALRVTLSIRILYMSISPVDNFGTVVGENSTPYGILALYAVNGLSKLSTVRWDRSPTHCNLIVIMFPGIILHFLESGSLNIHGAREMFTRPSSRALFYTNRCREGRFSTSVTYGLFRILPCLGSVPYLPRRGALHKTTYNIIMTCSKYSKIRPNRGIRETIMKGTLRKFPPPPKKNGSKKTSLWKNPDMNINVRPLKGYVSQF